MWSRSAKEKRAEWFEGHPLLRLLCCEPWLGTAFLVVLGIVLGVPLLLVRIWRSSPAGHELVVRVRGIDLLQAWSLRRSALRAERAHDLARAADCWQMAVAHSPADPALLRATLTHTLRLGSLSGIEASRAVRQSLLLLRLTRTNQADAVVAGQVLEQLRLADLTCDVLSPLAEPLDPALEALYLRALLQKGDGLRFGPRFERFARDRALEAEWELYRSAWQAGWGPPESAPAAQQRLEAALAQPAFQRTAHRLRLVVAAQRGQIESYAASLDWLREARADTIKDHVVYWHLLANGGQAEKARALASQFSRVPVSSGALLNLALVQERLGLREHALGLLRGALDEFTQEPMVWITYAKLLIEGQQWAELRTAAVRIRLWPQLAGKLAGYTHYLEGRAELGTGGRAMAEAAFKRAGEIPMDAPAALPAAQAMAELGYLEPALAILRRLEPELNTSADYWYALYSCAAAARDEALLRRAAAAAHKLQPANWVLANNYAMALLLAPTNTAEAVRLTASLLERNPRPIDARLNHSLALAMDQRADEAAVVLASLEGASFSPAQSNAYYQAWFGVHWQRGEYDQARRAHERIRQADLFPGERRWLETALRQMPPSTGLGPPP